MKSIFTAILFCLTIAIYGQTQTVTTLNFEEIVAIDDIELQLISVVDSRCPKNVSCIRAGEAKVVVEVFKNGKFLKQQTLTFHPSSINKNTTTLYTSNNLNIYGLKLFPYPQGLGKINEKDYVLELVIED